MYTSDPVIVDYRNAMGVARYWARIAKELHACGMPWHDSARNSHAALRYALLIIR